MRNTISVFLLFILLLNQANAQSTTSFKDNRWFDYKKYSNNFYSKPVHEQAEVIVSADSIITHLGSKIIRYKIKGVTDIATKNKSSREYKVENNGAELTISISRTKETYFGKDRKIAWISGGTDGWIVMVPLTSITPVGYLFPGDAKIDIEAERARIVGYYDYELMRRVDAEAYERAGANSYHLLIWTDDKCKKDVQIELRADNTGTWWYGNTAKACPNKAEQNFKWKLEHVVHEGRQAMMLTLTSDESNQYIIDQLTDKKLSLRGEFRIGDNDDTTSDGYLVLSKKKKK
jgi:hypothetical protein